MKTKKNLIIYVLLVLAVVLTSVATTLALVTDEHNATSGLIKFDKVALADHGHGSNLQVTLNADYVGNGEVVFNGSGEDDFLWVRAADVSANMFIRFKAYFTLGDEASDKTYKDILEFLNNDIGRPKGFDLYSEEGIDYSLIPYGEWVYITTSEKVEPVEKNVLKVVQNNSDSNGKIYILSKFYRMTYDGTMENDIFDMIEANNNQITLKVKVEAIQCEGISNNIQDAIEQTQGNNDIILDSSNEQSLEDVYGNVTIAKYEEASQENIDSMGPEKHTNNAGVYNFTTKELIMTWDELVEGEYLNVWKDELSDGYRIKHMGTNLELVIANNVRVIKNGCFAGFSSLKSVIIPDSVEIIENRAFISADLRYIDIANSVKYIGDSAFSGNTNIVDLHIPSSLEDIGENAFAQPAHLTTSTSYYLKNFVPNTKKTFATNEAISGLKPNEKFRVGKANYYVYYVACNDDPTKYICFGNTKYTIEDEEYFRVKDLVLADGTVALLHSSFTGRTMETVKFPNTIKYIASNAFNIDAKDSTITSLEVAAGGKYYESTEAKNGIIRKSNRELIMACTSYSDTFIVPDDVEIIGRYAFSATKLGKLSISSNTKIINAGIRSSSMTPSSNVSKVTFATINSTIEVEPDTVFRIGNETDKYIYYLACRDDATKYICVGSGGSYTVTSLLARNVVNILPGTIALAGSAFTSCTKITKVNMPTSLYSIGASAFSADVYPKLSEVKIPEGVKIIGEYAFNNFNVSKFILPSSLEYIGKYAFFCTGINSLEGVTDNLRIIEDNAFAHVTETANLGNLYIGAKVEYIGYDAFQRCKINSIVVSPNNKYYDSRENCNALICSKNNILLAGSQNTVIPSTIEEIGANAFYYRSCYTLTIPRNITVIRGAAFAQSSLTNLTMSPTVTYIGQSAFYATKIKEIDIPKTVVYIQDAAFAKCTNLTRANIYSTSIVSKFKWFLDSTAVEIHVSNKLNETSANELYGANWRIIDSKGTLAPVVYDLNV